MDQNGQRKSSQVDESQVERDYMEESSIGD
jgi:hypothetical protein